LIIRPLGNTLVLFPPLCITPENLGRMMDAVERAIGEVVPRELGLAGG
jgi:adenosylmethionine-8-amino-7-oxononanoate aminotransferase